MAKRSKEPAPVAEPDQESPAVPAGNQAPEPEMTPDPAPLPPAPPVSAPEEMPPAARPGPTLGARLGRFFRFLLRLVLVLLLLAAIGVGLYFGLPWLYQKYVVPVEQNTAEMRELRSRQEQTRQELADLQRNLETLQSSRDQQAQSLAELDGRLSDLETEVAARTQSLAALEEMQTRLQAQGVEASAELERQVSLMKSMELLSRARLFMYQSNFGLARQDVQIARETLAAVRPGAPEALAADLDAVLFRLDLILMNLPDFPVAASDDLDIAWQILLSGLPEATPTPDMSLTPDVTLTPSATPFPTFTPTPGVTVQPTAT